MDETHSPIDSRLSHPVSHGLLIKRIPRAARPSCAALFGDLIQAIVREPHSAAKWSDLLAFGGIVLAKPRRGGKKHNITKTILSRIADWRSKGPKHSTNDGLDSTASRKPKATKYDPTKYLASAVASKLEEGNFKAAIRLICSEDKPALDTPETLAALRLKHPPAPVDRRTPCDPNSSERFIALQVSKEEVAKAISSFPAGSAGGPDGITPQHLKDVVAFGVDDNIGQHLTDLVNLLLKGGLPEEVNDIIYGANLLALSKKDGGIRPIAVGYTWRRLAAKCANSYAVTRLSQLLAPIQLGVGIPGGAEAAVHATRRWLTTMPEDNVLVKLDFTNAFNTLRRDSLLEAVAKEIPELYRFAHASYSNRPLLRYGSSIILSEEGTQQGDPLGPLEFCLVLQPLLIKLKSDLRIGYLDDLTLGGKKDTVAADVQLIAEESKHMGLLLNRSKCEIACHNIQTPIDEPAFQEFSYMALEELTLLGAPLTPGPAVDKVLETKANDLERAITRLSLLHTHDALVLLRNSLSVPKLLYNMRTAVCIDCPGLARFDRLLREGLSTILNVDLDDDRWLQASLPVRDGGLGVRCASTLALSAFLASAASTSELQARILPTESAEIPYDLQNTALEAWKAVTGADPPTGTSTHLQKEWDIRFTDKAWTGLLESTSYPRDRARLLASRAPHSGDWMLAPPVTALGLRLSDEEVRIAVGMRLGTTLCEPHLCHQCRENVDASGLHGLVCRGGGGKHQRHSMINDVIWRAMGRAKIPAHKEPLGLSREDGKRPDGVTLIPWTRGRCLAWDVTVPDTYATSHLAHTSIGAGEAAERAAVSKRVKYSTITTTHAFVAVALETGGAWCEEGLQLVSELGRRTHDITHDPQETSYLLQRISVALQRGNAICISGTLPPLSELC